ncbi:tetratricopeptide repeat-containing sulfotransferase family protein [Rhodanobacter hydrolyticus]|uniref:Sulfotransferase n=1 Tax=Rhodanobacter hydrolyticus TaxID=2250595 RepID=A0ABW8J5Y4_9GAMM
MDPINTNPSSVSLNDLLASASRAMAAQKLVTAEQALKQAASIAPDSAEVQRLSGVVQLMRGNPGKAVEYLRRAVELQPDDSNAHMNLGSALFECRYTDAGLASMRRACELAPSESSCWYNLGRAMHIARKPSEARPILMRAMALDPSHIMTRMTLANAQNSLGEIAEAANLYRSVLKIKPGHANAWFELCNLKTTRLDGSEIEHIKELLKRPGISSDDQIWLGYALAKALEDQDDLTASFHALQTASAIQRRSVSWDIQAERERIDGIIKTFDRPLPHAVDAALGHEVVFISCLPRSGSTLTEHILASHSMVEGANEISELQVVLAGESNRRGQFLTQWAPLATAEDWHRLGYEYLERTALWREGKPYSTDKSLGNWSLIGPALAMLPGARVVNTLRDPLETCFACYRQLFSDGASFSYDFESMANYYAGYVRMCKFWKERFPGNWHNHVYEDMLADPEGKIRELLSFCGLPFEPNCLEFHKTLRAVRSTASAAQVRQPLQSNTSRASRYGTLLDPLRDLLHRLEIE